MTWLISILGVLMVAGFWGVRSSHKKLLDMNKRLAISEGSFRIALSHMACLVFEYDADTDSALLLNSFFNLKAGSRLEHVSKELKCKGKIHCDDIKIFDMILSEAVQGHSVPPTGLRMQIQEKDTDFRWYRISITNIAHDEAKSTLAVGTLDDIGEFKISEIKLLREEQYRRAIMSQTVENYEFNLSRDEKIRCDGILDEGWSENKTKYTEIVDYVCENMVYFEDMERVNAVLNRDSLIREFEKGVTEYSIEYRRKVSGTYIWVRCNLRLIRDPFTEDIIALCYIDDINSCKQNELLLKRRAETDCLTGLLNRGTAEKIVNAYLEGDGGQKENAFLLIDLDGFKTLNDTYGHIQGDVFLRSIAAHMKRIFRTSDVIGRIGGDEFVVFMKDIGNLAVATQKSVQMINSIQCMEIEGCEEHVLSCSIGIAYSDIYSTFAELYSKADMALYRAKAIGKATYVIYENELACES